MKNLTFNELYKFYQETFIAEFESAIKKKGWTITSRHYKSIFSTDVANLEINIKFRNNENSDQNDITFWLQNAWLDFLFIDRDEFPRRLNLQILNPSYGMGLIKNLINTRIELFDADEKKDKEKFNLIAQNAARVRIYSPIKNDPTKQKIIFHYENGYPQNDVGAIVDTEEDEKQ